MATKIPWTDETWNPAIGCTKVSAGCQNCYAEKMMYRQVCMGAARHLKDPDSNEDAWIAYSDVMNEDTHGWNGAVSLRYSQLDKPLHWRKPRMIFVCSMGDLFHEAVPFEFIDEVVQVILACYQHTFQIPTKRPEMVLKYVEYMRQRLSKLYRRGEDWQWPSNVWLGVTCENQKAADERIPILLQIPAAVRFVSVEPMLEKVNVASWGWRNTIEGLQPRIDWVIVGCESGSKRRECKIGWVRDLVNQCKDANVPVFVKQLSIKGNVSHDMSEWPEDLRIREYPKRKEK